jgi:hypothetical protein
MSKFNKMRERISQLYKKYSEPKIIKQIDVISYYLDSQEKYYDSIPDSIKTENTLNVIITKICNRIEYLEKKNSNDVVIDFNWNNGNQNDRANTQPLISAAFLSVNPIVNDGLRNEIKKLEVEIVKLNAEKETIAHDNIIETTRYEESVKSNDNLKDENLILKHKNEEILALYTKINDENINFQNVIAKLNAEKETITQNNIIETNRYKHLVISNDLNEKNKILNEVEIVKLNEQIKNLENKLVETKRDCTASLATSAIALDTESKLLKKAEDTIKILENEKRIVKQSLESCNENTALLNDKINKLENIIKKMERDDELNREQISAITLDEVEEAKEATETKVIYNPEQISKKKAILDRLNTLECDVNNSLENSTNVLGVHNPHNPQNAFDYRTRFKNIKKDYEKFNEDYKIPINKFSDRMEILSKKIINRQEQITNRQNQLKPNQHEIIGRGSEEPSIGKTEETQCNIM